MQVATIEIKRSRGQLVVIATGRTGRGQRFIKATKALAAESMTDKNFKAEMAAAVTELMASEVLPL